MPKIPELPNKLEGTVSTSQFHITADYRVSFTAFPLGKFCKETFPLDNYAVAEDCLFRILRERHPRADIWITLGKVLTDRRRVRHVTRKTTKLPKP